MKIINNITNIKNDISQSIKLQNVGDNNYIINFNNHILNEIDVHLYNMKGQTIFTEHRNNLKENTNVLLDYNKINTGVYILDINHKNINLFSTKIIIQ